MLTLYEIKATVNTVAEDYPLKKVSLFGSYASGSQNENSDVDLLVEFSTPAVSLITLASLKYRLQEELGKEVDIIHGPLNPDALIKVEKAVPIYEQ